jgi:hypothetical protein
MFSVKWVFVKSFIMMVVLLSIKLDGYVVVILNKRVLTMTKLFLQFVRLTTFVQFLAFLFLLTGPSANLDIKNAFLHGSLQETVYCQQPLCFEDSSHPNHVCLLQKSLYGLKQAPCTWFHRLSAFIQTIGFIPSLSDTSLFIFHDSSNVSYLLLYVDDIVLTASSPSFLEHVISPLRSEFSMTDLGSLHHFLGMAIVPNASGLFLSPCQYILDLLSCAGMLDCQPSRTPVDTSSKLSAEGEPFSDASLYHTLTGTLQYLALTCPDISFDVQQASLYMHDPRLPHYNHAKRILCYLKGTLDHSFHINTSSSTSLTMTLMQLGWLPRHS